MATKQQIQKLTERQAKLALIHLQELTFSTTCGAIWSDKIDEALKVANSQKQFGMSRRLSID